MIEESNQASVLTFNDISVGDVFQYERSFSAKVVDDFARLSADFSPIHCDASYAEETEFGSRVVHGMLVATMFTHLVGMRIPGKHALLLGYDMVFRRPVMVGETLMATSKVTSKNAGTRTIVLTNEARNSENLVVATGTAKVKLRDDQPIETQVAKVRPVVPTLHAVALVTGASRGIGAAIASRLAKSGLTIAVNYLRSDERAEQVVESICQGGGQAFGVPADVRDPQAMRRVVEHVMDRCGGLDFVVNAAVGELHQRQFIDLTWSDFEAHLDHQVKGVMNVCQAAYPHMRARGGGAIVNLLSQVASGSPPARMADYVVAKHALKGLSRALASEWAAESIRINTVSPGLTQTELTNHYNERIFKMEASRTPLKRLAQPNDIANAVAYLLSDEASFLTGVDISVTGGQVMA